MGTNSEPAMAQKQGRERAWDEQHVVEPGVKENDMQVWLHQPAVQRVERAGGEKERVAKIGERFHSNAKMRRPKPRPSEAFSKMTSTRLSRAFIGVYCTSRINF